MFRLRNQNITQYLWRLKNIQVALGVSNTLPNNLDYNNPQKKGEKEETLVNSIFFFSHNIFYPIKDKSIYIGNIYPLQFFNLNKNKMLPFGKGLSWWI